MQDLSAGRPAVQAGAVFVSYASEDSEAAARIAEALKTAGVEVWFDKSELRGGDSWDQTIRQRIRECALFVPIVSHHAQARTEGYFRLEWRLADQRSQMMGRSRAFLMPVCVDDTGEKDADVPDSFCSVQWTRLPAGVASPEFVHRIAALIEPRGLDTGGDRATAPLPVTAHVRKSRRRSLWIAVAATALAIAASGAWLGLRYRAPEIPAASDARAAKSLAVLPFADLSEKHDQEYFADGLADEVLSLLATLPGLTVISRTSSFQFKGKSADVRAVAAQLGVSYIVEGSVKRSGDRVRVTAQLISAADGARRWSDTSERDFDNVLRLQKDIAASLGRALQVEVVGLGEQGALRHPEAYTAYLRGLHAMDEFDETGLEEAVAYFEQAAAIDTRDVRAREGIARARYYQYVLGIVTPATAAGNLRRAVDEVLSVDPQSATGHALRAEISITYDWDWATAENEVRMAMSAGPNNEVALYAAGDLASVYSNWDDAERFIRQALAADPLDPDTRNLLSWTLYRHGHFKEAAVEGRRVIEIRPTYVLGHLDLGLYLLAGGDAKAALTEMTQEVSDKARPAGLALALSAVGQSAAADAALRNAERESADEFAYFIACAHALRGETDAAFRWLDRAYAQKDYLLEYIKDDPTLRSLVRDPRYNAFIRRLNLPE